MEAVIFAKQAARHLGGKAIAVATIHPIDSPSSSCFHAAWSLIGLRFELGWHAEMKASAGGGTQNPF